MPRKWNDDPYTKKARSEDYLARSIYKLEEIDRRERIFSGVKTVLDLGASPGSWTQYALEKTPRDVGRVYAVDISPLRVADDRLVFLETSIETVDWPTVLEGRTIDLVLSDMAPKTSGMHDRDTYLSYELSLLALDVARKWLKPKGSFVAKLFMGAEFEAYHKDMKQSFEKVRLIRPETTRKHSREIYFIGKGKK